MRFQEESIVFLCIVITYGCPAKLPVLDNELECYSQEKVYHEETGKCYKVLTKGPCQAGEWLVLEKPSSNERDPRIKPICVKEKCEEGKYYWAKTGSCVDAEDKKILCSREEELLSNVFGEGECFCTREPPAVRINGDKNGACYQLYTRGPCRVGQVFALPANETSKPACVEDKCHRESVHRRKNGTLSKHGVLAPFTNGTCYELGTQGPCGSDLIFKVHTNSLRPSCVSLTTNIFNLQRPQNCYQDENGDCQQQVHSVRKRLDCASPLSHIFSGVKQCPVDENGDCQKQVTKKKGNKYLKELTEYLKNT